MHTQNSTQMYCYLEVLECVDRHVVSLRRIHAERRQQFEHLLLNHHIVCVQS